MLEDDPRLLDLPIADSDTVANDSRNPPGDGGILGSIDLGLDVRLEGSSLTGEVEAEETSGFVGDCTRRFVNTSILLSKLRLISSSPSRSLILTRMLSTSHWSSAVRASFISSSSSRIRMRLLSSRSVSKRLSLSS